MKALTGTSWGATGSTLKRTYNACVRPVLEYACESWSAISECQSKILDKVQFAASRTICGLYKHTPGNVANELAGLQSLSDRRLALAKNWRLRTELLPPQHITSIAADTVTPQRTKRSNPMTMKIPTNTSLTNNPGIPELNWSRSDEVWVARHMSGHTPAWDWNLPHRYHDCSLCGQVNDPHHLWACPLSSHPTANFPLSLQDTENLEKFRNDKQLLDAG